jgi:hypothetical protein
MPRAVVYPGEVRCRVQGAPFGQIQNHLQPRKEFYVRDWREGRGSPTPVIGSEGQALLLLRLDHTDMVTARGTMAKFVATHLILQR